MGGKRTNHQHGARRYARVVGVIGALAVVSAVALPALDASAAILASYTPSVSPGTATAATAGQWTIKFLDNEPLGSVDTINTATATFPAGFTNLSVPSSVTDSNGNSWTVGLSNNTVTLNGSMGPKASVSVPVSGKAPSAPTTYTVTTSASGGINGLLGQPWDRSGSEPTITVGPGAPAGIVFTQQPTDVKTGVKMSPVVAVKVVDSVGNTVTTYNQSVTLHAAYNPVTGTAVDTGLSGNTVSAVGGIAKFPNLALGSDGSPYILKAASGSLTSNESNPFAVADVVTPCPAAGCQTGFTGSAGVQLNTVEGSGTNGDTLTGTTTPSAALGGCGTGSIGDAFFFTSHDKNRSITATVQYSKDVWNAISANGAGNPTLCFETLAADTNNVPWIQDSGLPATLTADHRFFVGNAPKCPSKITPPCWSGNKTGAGVFVATIYSIAGADPGGIFK